METWCRGSRHEHGDDPLLRIDREARAAGTGPHRVTGRTGRPRPALLEAHAEAEAEAAAERAADRAREARAGWGYDANEDMYEWACDAELSDGERACQHDDRPMAFA